MNQDMTLFLRRRWLKGGNCLKHVTVLIAMSLKFADCDVVACMGIGSVGPHCWLEADALVVDLTKSQRFYDRDWYYERAQLDVHTVKRYSAKECAERLLRDGLTFWDFEEGDAPE